MTALDASLIAERLEARFGIALDSGFQEVDGGTFAYVRPAYPEWPNGFAILVSRTNKLLEASLKLDSYAKSLVRQMMDSDESQKKNFVSQVSRANDEGLGVRMLINDDFVVSIEEFPTDEWNRVEIDCEYRLGAGKLSNSPIDEASLEVTSLCLSLVLNFLGVEEQGAAIAQEQGLPEGAVIRIEVNKYERSPINRASCISHYGCTCQVCGFDFLDNYGEIGREYIEVHHKTPVSEMGSAYRIDPVNDLVPVCANCHSMIHRKKPPLSIEELKAIISSKSNGDTN